MKDLTLDPAKPVQRRLSRPGGVGLVLGGLLVVAIAAVYAYATAFSYFSSYDDEGYALVTVRGFLEGHRLYQDVFTYYGPFYFLYQWLLHAVLAVPLTHDATTLLCVVHWLLGSLVLAWAGFRLTRSWLIACLVFMQVSLHLTPLAREPGHPQELVVLLLCVAVVIGAGELPLKRLASVLAGIGAVMVFTKINVGVFFGCALLLVLAGRAAFFKAHRVAFLAALLLAGSLPFVLMRPNLGEEWAFLFSVQSCAAILAAGAVLYFFGRKEDVGLPTLLQAGAVFAAVSGLLILVVMLNGTSVASLFDALVRQPARLGSSFSIPLKVGYGFLSAGFALIGAGVVIGLRARKQSMNLAVAVLKLGFGFLGTIVLVTRYNQELSYLLPWSWLVLLSPASGEGQRDQSAPGSFARALLCLLAVWQSLQAYPVAGTQAAIGTLFLALIYGVFLHDAWLELSLQQPIRETVERALPRTRALLRTLAFAGLLYLFASQWCNPLAAWRYYQSVPPLALPGAQLLRLPLEQGETYRTLTRCLQTQGDLFQTIPGFNSLYFWTRKAPPTYLNTAERLVLNPAQQTSVIAALHRGKHPLIVFTDEGTSVPESVGPLGVLLHQQCREIARFGAFRILAVEPVPASGRTMPTTDSAGRRAGSAGSSSN